MPNLGPVELIIILAVILVLFGGRKLPELAKGLGQGLKEFRSASRDTAEDEKKKEVDA